ncbi:MAG: glycosyltransferase family 4 protein [Cyclobacteriaceae bacterium]|nr:glycosyltransferase family 4 protein [Cyclobacteriaceae bacterium]MCH8517284.1 glycosyltransferase family 4 protein [Cyclobacteriaceae bacterium]
MADSSSNLLRLLFLGPEYQFQGTSGMGKNASELYKYLKKHFILVSAEAARPKDIRASTSDQVKYHNIERFEYEIQKEIAYSSLRRSMYSFLYDQQEASTEMAIHARKEKTESTKIDSWLEVYQAFTQQTLDRLKNTDFDIIYSHDWVNVEVAMDLKEKNQAYWVLHLHAIFSDRLGQQSALSIQAIEAAGVDRCDHIICGSYYHKKLIIQNFKCNPAKISVVHPIFELEKSIIKRKVFEEKVITFAGRLVDQKNPEQFLQIATIVKNQMADCRFIIVGDGYLLEDLIESGIRAKFEGKLHFAGELSEQELHEVFAFSDLLCMPSESEPFGLVALEAAQSGLAVVCSNRCGATELLPGARIVRENEPHAFAKEIVSLLEDPNAYHEAVEKNHQYLHAYPKDSYFQSIQEILSQATSK